MKAWWRKVRPRILAWPIYCIVRIIGQSVRLRLEGYERTEAIGGGKIYAGWHGRTFIAANYFKGKGLWTIISQSNDGELQDRIFRKFGFRTIRGSSGRGGARAAVESIKVLREGAVMAFTPDGPRGPSHVVQDGIILMAQKSGAWLVPVGVSARRRRLVKTWDSYMVPGLFSDAIMIFGEPIHVPENARSDEVEAIRVHFENQMIELEDRAEIEMGHSAAVQPT